MPVTVTPLGGPADRRAFRLLPFRLYAGDPHWVPPLNRDVRAFLDTTRHPFYRDARACFFLARRDGRVAGRVAAIENHAHNRYHQDHTGFFGFLEAEQDPEVTAALVRAAASWLQERGLDRMRGPVSPSTNYETGLLVEGSPGPPAFMMPHNPPWYAEHLEQAGLSKAMDLYAYDMRTDFVDGTRWSRMASRVRARTGADLRPLDTRRLDSEVPRLIELYHDAWSGNWGFVPLNDAEVRAMVRDLRPLLRPDLAAFVVHEGREVGYFLGLPDYNRVLIGLRGRLFPTGFLRLLRAKHRLDRMRVMLMGVARSHRHLGLDVLLHAHAFQGGADGRITSCEASWVLESNLPMINLLERVGARRYRTYRLLEAPLPL